MILIENREILRKKNRELLSEISSYENKQPPKDVVIEESKRGGLTLKVAIENKMQYVHSKYDPEKDAERFVEKLEVNPEQHILFVGVGLGYHIERFHEQYPDVNYSIYEPRAEVMYAYLSTKKMPEQNLEKIIVGISPESLSMEINQLLAETKGKLQLITLPIYEKLYQKEITMIQQKAIEALKDKRNALAVNISFQKRWTINAIKNFPTVLSTPNILHDIDKKTFEGKPAIIVAAGPSLNEEFENLRYIKENGLAYIFSVGSAINALIEHGIYPDAACTYDPQDINYRVIQVIKDKNITDIPLIFGSSVGYETLEEYPGNMLHMLVSQDTISPALLGNNLITDLDYVNDAPSIAVVTYQLLSQLGCKQIILVGQNLAYVGDNHYASGIDYGRGTKAKETELEKSIYTEDVHGKKVQTNDGFNAMRHQLEMYVEMYPQIETINTTNGGAHIQGTIFKGLEEVIQKQLKKRTVEENWFSADNHYDIQLVEKNLSKLDEEKQKLGKQLKNSMRLLEDLNKQIETRIFKNIENMYGKFDASIVAIKENHFYRSFIEPMIRVQNEQLAEKIGAVRYEKNEQRKGEIVVTAFYAFLQEISANHYFAIELFEEMKQTIDV